MADRPTPTAVLQRVANRGDANAQVELGRRFHNGTHGLPQDYTTAVKCSGMYEYGYSVVKDMTQAVGHYLLGRSTPDTQPKPGRWSLSARRCPRHARGHC